MVTHSHMSSSDIYTYNLHCGAKDSVNNGAGTNKIMGVIWVRNLYNIYNLYYI